MAGVWETLFGSPPLQPVQGDPVNPAYSRMPSATAPITDVRGQGVGAWMSRPHDQNLQSRNMGGYYNNNIQMGGPAFQWQRTHGWAGRDPPSTTLEPPDYYADPSITAHIRAAQDSAPPDPQRSLQIAGPLSGHVGRTMTTNFSTFKSQISEWMNRADWSDDLVTSFIRMAEAKLNAELRIDRQIQFDEALIASRCAPLPDDWLQMELVRIANDNVPDGFIPLRYKSRDEFYTTVDNWMTGFYTIQGRQIYIGGVPDAINGQVVKLTYYAEVPVFSDTVESYIYTKYPSLYLNAAAMYAFLHGVGEEDKAAAAKQLVEDSITKLNALHATSRASGSRVTRTRTRSFG